MKCGFCGDSDTELCLAPVDFKEGWACQPCLVANGLYCETHDQTHARFTSGGHACLPCIEDAVRENADLAAEYEARIRAAIAASEIELADLEEWIAVAKSMTSDLSTAITLLRAVMTYAARNNIPHAEVVIDIEERRTAAHLLPTWL